MDVKDEHGAIVAKLSLGTILTPAGDLLAHLRKNTLTDVSGNVLGYVRHGMVIGPNGDGLALYTSTTISTYAKTSTFTFTGRHVKNYAGDVVLILTDEYIQVVEELIAFIVFFSELWLPKRRALALSVT